MRQKIIYDMLPDPDYLGWQFFFIGFCFIEKRLSCVWIMKQLKNRRI